MACAAPAATVSLPVIADGISLGELAEALPELPLCADCAERQRRALRRPLYARRGFALVPGVLTGLASAFLPLGEPLLAVLLFAALVAAWVVGLRAFQRRRSARLSALVCGGDKGIVEVRVSRQPAGASSKAPARTAYRTMEGLEVRPAPAALRARDEMSNAFVVGGTIAGAVIAGVAWNGLYVDVHCTSGEATSARLVVDGEAMPVAKGSSVHYVRSGSHVFGVECPGPKRRLFQSDLTADDRVFIDVQDVCSGGNPKVLTSFGQGMPASPFRGI